MVDTFAGPPKKQGVIGRLILDRALANYGTEIIVALSGLSSETITFSGEGVSGKIIGYPILYMPNGIKSQSSVVQNGTYTIRIDDLDESWDTIALVKSGSLDRVRIDIESLFDYVEPLRGGA